MWATAALTWAEGEHTWVEGELCRNRAWAEPKNPDNTLSQPAYYNMEPILASYVPRLQFSQQILPGDPFLLPYKVPTGQVLDTPLVPIVKLLV